MEPGRPGVSGKPAVRHVVMVTSRSLVHAQIPLLSTGVWTALEMKRKSESALSATVLFTVSGCFSLIGQTVVRAVMRALVDGLGTLSQRNTVEKTAAEMQLKLRSATHRHVQVR